MLLCVAVARREGDELSAWARGGEEGARAASPRRGTCWMGGRGGLAAHGSRAAAARGRACSLMMDCAGRVRVVASDPRLSCSHGSVVGICVWGRQPIVQRRLELQSAIGGSGSGSSSSSGGAAATMAVAAVAWWTVALLQPCLGRSACPERLWRCLPRVRCCQ